MQKIRRNDVIIVIAGKDKGSTGTVTKVIGSKNNTSRVIVESINMVKKHTKPNPNKGVAGGVVSTEMSLSISNVAIYNSDSEKADRVGLRMNEEGTKERFFKSNGITIN